MLESQTWQGGLIVMQVKEISGNLIKKNKTEKNKNTSKFISISKEQNDQHESLPDTHNPSEMFSPYSHVSGCGLIC